MATYSDVYALFAGVIGCSTVASMIAIPFPDKFGRRPILIIGAFGVRLDARVTPS